MRTDFREERKWKMTVAKNLAYACAEWVDSGLEDRRLLQVKATPPPHDTSRDVEMGEGSSQAGAHPTPELVASADSPIDELDEEPRLNLLETISPTAIFGLQDDDVVFGLRRSPTTDKLLNELPIYGAPLMVPQSDLPTSDIDPDRFWKRPALPLSKFVEGRLELKVDPPPRKRSRFEYELEDDNEDHVVFGEQKAKAPILPPENSDVALFDPQHKHIRDRIHSSHQFRPPSEFQMPPQSFYENRSMSQWTWDEDNELKNFVREYSYNWGLISNMLTSKSLFSSGAERRTPWECFERWVQTEGMPADMGRTHYFRMYTNRIDQANRNVLAQQQQVPQQPNANGQVQAPPRRRPTSSIRVDRRRNQKHLTLVDAMRKLAKKRETNAQKQQHAAGMAAMRKANEVPHPANRQMPATTPQDFSRLKHEREEQFKERMVQLQQRQEQQRRVNIPQIQSIYEKQITNCLKGGRNAKEECPKSAGCSP
jgi:chromatin modification-related protein VID21